MNDQNELLRGFRAGFKGPAPETVATAKQRFIEDTVERSPHFDRAFSRRRYVATTAVVCAVISSVVAVHFWSGAEVTEPAAAAELRAVAVVAADAPPPPERLGRNQYILTRYSYVASSTITFTQKRLDRLSRDRYRQLVHSGGHFVRAPGMLWSEIDRQDRLQRKYLKRVKRGVKLAELRAKTVTVSQSQPIVSWVNERHIGAGGGLPGEETSYGSGGQRASVRRLDRAGIFIYPSVLHEATIFSEANLLEEFTWPSVEIAKLPTEAKGMEAALRYKPVPLPRVGLRHRIENDSQLFHAAIGLLRSPFASPEQRSAIVLMLGDLDGVTIETDVGDARGRHGLGLKLTTNYGFEQVVFDQTSSQVLGVNFVIERPRVLAGANALYLRFADSASFGVVYQPTVIVRGRPTCRIDLGHEMKGETFCEKHVRPVIVNGQGA